MSARDFSVTSAGSGRTPGLGVLGLAVPLGAALLFQIQPLSAGRLLPAFGGGPVVWTTSLLFFQAALLAGYAAAARVPLRVWRRWLLPTTGLALLATVLLPAPGALAGPDRAVPRLLVSLACEAGLPYLVLAAGAPLLTRVAEARLAPGRSLHRLYALSNLGSAVGLLVGPLLLDAWAPRSAQRLGFLVGFTLWSLAVQRALGQATDAPSPAPDAPPATPAPRAARSERAAWLLHAGLGTALLATVTAWLSQDLSVTPLLWVLPLLVYLGTYIVAFGLPRAPTRAATTAGWALGLAALLALLHGDWRLSWGAQLSGGLFVLAAGAFHAHAELVRRRPAPALLPEFYLVLAAGGALGTLLAGLVLPALLPVPLELPLVSLVAWLAAVQGNGWLRSRRPGGLGAPGAFDDAAPPDLRPRGPRAALAVGLTIALVAGLGLFAAKRLRGDAVWSRSVFGALQVRTLGKPPAPAAPDLRVRNLLDGRISHGFQFVDPARRREPTTYFGPESGIGRLLARPGPPRAVAILGLGVGTLAAWARPGDRFRLYELNPAALEVARRDFTFLADAEAAGAGIELVQGDARRALAEESGTAYDLVIVDAFCGDAIPLHLLTEEAMAVYLSHLASDGVLAINASNAHVELARALWWHADRFGLAQAFRTAVAPSPLGPYRSDWAFLAFTAEALRLPGEGAPPPLPDVPAVRLTDDFAPLLPLLK